MPYIDSQNIENLRISLQNLSDHVNIIDEILSEATAHITELTSALDDVNTDFESLQDTSA